MRKTIRFLFLGFLCWFLYASVSAQSVSMPTDPARPTIITTANGKTIGTADGELFRGVSVLYRKSKWVGNGEQWHGDEYWKQVADSGFNAVRVALYDPGRNQADYAQERMIDVPDFSDPNQAAEFLIYLDSLVDKCSKYNLYVLLNSHMVLEYMGEFRNRDAQTMGYQRDMWTVLANHYKDRTHVFFESLNEPLWLKHQYYGLTYANQPKEQATWQLIDSIAVLYELIHDIAPNTMQCLFSFATPRSQYDGDPPVYDIYDVVKDFDTRHAGLVDWNNTAVAFHPYQNGGTSEWVTECMAEYPTFSSESNWPTTVSGCNLSGQRSTSMDGEVYVTQTFERLNTSWFHWTMSNPEQFDCNFPKLYNDAKSKGYLWFGGTRHNLDITYNTTEGTVYPGSRWYYEGRKAPLEAIPATGYKFSHWSGDVNSTNRIEHIEMNSNKNVTAHFVATSTYNLSTDEQGDGYVKVYSSGPYNAGSKVFVKAMPNNEFTHKFSHWTGDVPEPNIQNQYIVMDANKSITAHFIQKTGVEIKAWVTGSTGDEAFSLSLQDAVIPGVEVGVMAHYGVGGNAFKRQFTEFTTIVEGVTNVTPDQVRVHFINNSVHNGPDKNLCVDKISIDGVVYETESDDVFSTGGWKGGPKVNDGLSKDEAINTEWLYRPVKGNQYIFYCYFHYGQGTGARYELSVNENTNGSVIPGDNSVFLDGEEISVEATGNVGYSFSHWSGDLSGSQNPVKITMNGNKSITANWTAVASYSVSTNTGSGNGTIELVPAGGTYTENTLVTATAIPDPGFIFSQWKGDVNSDIFSAEVFMDGNKSITADYSKVEILQTNSAPTIDGTKEALWSNSPQYSVTRVVSGGVNGVDDASILWTSQWDNNNLYVFMTVNDDAKVKENGSWYNDDVAEIYIDADNSKSASYGANDFQYIFPWNGTMEETKHNAISGVNYSLVETANGYNVEVSIPWSTLGVNPAANDFIGIEVQMDDDDDGDGRDAKLTWFGIEDIAWSSPATFGSAQLVSSISSVQYTLGSLISGTGDVRIKPAAVDGIYNEGQEVELTSNDLLGSEFSHWTGNASGTDKTVTITMNSNKNVTANYNSISSYTLTTEVFGNGGSIKMDKNEDTFNDGTVVNLSAIDEPGYAFDHWSGNIGGANANSRNIALTMDANRSVTANFTPVTMYSLSMVSNGHVRLDPAGGVYNEGTVVTATANSGYKLTFSNWTGDASGTNNQVQVIMNGNKNITANYTQESFEKSAPLPTDPPRLEVVKNSIGYTLERPDNGEILRGNAAVIWKAKLVNDPGSRGYLFDDAYYQALVDSGVNTIRLGLMDPYFNTAALEYTEVLDFSNPNDLEWIYGIVDSIVDLTSKHDLQLILCYFDVGEYRGEFGLGGKVPSIKYLQDFWTAMAPRYRDRTHVSYELVNEPMFEVNSWGDDIFDNMAEMYELVRYLAPETHIMNFCVTGALGKPWDKEHHIKSLIDIFEEKYPDLIDWSNASIAFHPYTNDWEASTAPLIETMADYAVINTESNFRSDEDIPVLDRDNEVQNVEGDKFVNQSMERLGIGWIHWKTSGWDHFNANWPLILKDAREKGYIWFGPDACNKVNLTVVNDNAKGTVTPGSGLICEDEVVNLTCNGLTVDGVSYALDHWSGDIGDASPTNNPINISMNGDKSITAHYKVVGTYTLTTHVEPTGAGSVSPSGTNDYSEGNVVPVQASNNSGYIFSHWSGGSNSTDASIDVTINSNINLTANFVEIEAITLEAECGTVGSKWETVNDATASNGKYMKVIQGTPTESSTAPSEADDRLEFTFNVNTGGNYKLWFRTITETVGDDSYWVKVPTATNNSSWINYNNIPLSTGWKWDDVHNANNGNNAVSFDLPSGSNTLYIAYREDETKIDKIYIVASTESGPADSDDGPDASNCGVQPVTYTLTTTATNGNISLNPTGGTYNDGETVTATATADGGYDFTDWDGASEATTSPVDIVMNGNKSLTANFTPILVSSISIPEGDQSLEVDSTYQFTVDITPTDALDQSVTWEVTSGSAYASVDANGLVTADAAGTATIMATTNEGSNLSASIEVTVTDPPVGGESLTAAFAFGADSYTTETSNEAGTSYVKVVQNGANFTYSSALGHGYTETGDIDGSANNRNSSACGEELYDQFIGVKNGGDITFRVDVPNGDYQFVTVMGDAAYGHTNTLQVRDGSTGTALTLIDNVTCAKDEYATVAFGDKTIIPCSGATFTAQASSPTLTVTSGYIDIIQSTPNTGGDLVLVEIWSTSGGTPTTYTLATNVGTGGSSVGVSPDQASYDENEEVTLTPNAQSGYEFLEWTGTETGSSNPLVINMTDDENITANFSPILVSSISIPEGDQTITVGNSFQFTKDVTPNDALDQSVTWEVTSGSAYASVDANGLVTANAAGTATIMATTNDGSNLSASVEVTVTAAGIDPETLSFQDGVSPDANYEGTHDVLIAGEWGYQQTTNYNGSNLIFDDYRSSLIKWDLSSIPSGASITSAEITFFNYTVSSDEYEIYEVTKDWVDSEATWMIAKTGQNWEIAGAKGSSDHGSTVLGTINMSGSWSTQTYPLNSDGVALIQSWIDGTKTNYGFIIQDYTNTSRGQFHKEADSDVNKRPKLTLTGTNLRSAKVKLDMESVQTIVKLYPNPTSSNAGLYVELTGFENETEATISIMDISGRIAYSTNVQTQDIASQRVSISLDGVSSGMYMVIVRSNNKMINQRLIVK